MNINPGGLLVLAGVAIALRLALSPNAGPWLPLAEVAASVVILFTVAGFLRHQR